MAELWERQEYDTDRSWEAFVLYRDMPKRSLQKVADEYYMDTNSANLKIDQKQTIKSNYMQLNQMKKWSAKHKWVARAEAWDIEVDRLKRVSLANGIGKMRENHAKIALNLENIIAERIKNITKEDVDKMSFSELCKLTETATKLERISRGDAGEVVEERIGEALDPIQFYMPDDER